MPNLPQTIAKILAAVFSHKEIDVGTLLTFLFFFFGWCPMFLSYFVSDFVERRGEKPSASTRVRIIDT